MAWIEQRRRADDANPVVAEDLTTVLALLDERRNNVITQRTRLVNQLHALLRDLVPGGAALWSSYADLRVSRAAAVDRPRWTPKAASYGGSG
jgi:hypothetical protein